MIPTNKEEEFSPPMARQESCGTLSKSRLSALIILVSMIMMNMEHINNNNASYKSNRTHSNVVILIANTAYTYI